MNLVCMDLEGVLIPEIWINVARKTGIDDLKVTTRDISDYDVLMKRRISILKDHGLTLRDIQNVIEEMDPLDGAKEFLDAVRSKTQIVILSDTFEEFAKPLMRKLGWPTLFCNSLVVDAGEMIIDYTLRQQDGKRKAVEAFRSMGFRIIASGDSYNDLTMIQKADRGILFRAPESIKNEYPEIPFVTGYDEFLEEIEKFLQ